MRTFCPPPRTTGGEENVIKPETMAKDRADLHNAGCNRCFTTGIYISEVEVLQAELSRLRAELEEKTEACKRWEAGFLADSGRMMEMKSRVERAEAKLAKVLKDVEGYVHENFRSPWCECAGCSEILALHDAGVRAPFVRLLERIVLGGCGCDPKCQCNEPGALRVWKDEVRATAKDLLQEEREKAGGKDA